MQIVKSFWRLSAHFLAIYMQIKRVFIGGYAGFLMAKKVGITLFIMHSPNPQNALNSSKTLFWGFINPLK